MNFGDISIELIVEKKILLLAVMVSVSFLSSNDSYTVLMS
jgi:hypothetical protein